jgi:hypothetical protein
MDENKFWIGIWALGASVITVITITLVLCSMHTKDTFSKAVAAGNDPMRVSCSLGLGQYEIAQCALIASKEIK